MRASKIKYLAPEATSHKQVHSVSSPASCSPPVSNISTQPAYCQEAKGAQISIIKINVLKARETARQLRENLAFLQSTKVCFPHLMTHRHLYLQIHKSRRPLLASPDIHTHVHIPTTHRHILIYISKNKSDW